MTLWVGRQRVQGTVDRLPLPLELFAGGFDAAELLQLLVLPGVRRIGRVEGAKLVRRLRTPLVGKLF